MYFEYCRLGHVFKVHNGQAWDRTKGCCRTVTAMLPLHHLAGSGESSEMKMREIVYEVMA